MAGGDKGATFPGSVSTDADSCMGNQMLFQRHSCAALKVSFSNDSCFYLIALIMGAESKNPGGFFW